MIRKHQSLVLTAALLMAATCTNSLQASDHFDAPSILIDGRMDVSDAYIFQSPTKPDHTVMAMTVNPLAGLLSPSTFNQNVAYDFAIDRNGDAAPDFFIRVRFSQFFRSLGKQYVIVRYLYDDQDILAAVGLTGDDIPLRGGGFLRADLFDDPFFFDFLGFQDGFNFTGMDFFEGFNVSGIVIEYPSARLGGQNISLVGRTLVSGFQQDRAGRPAINTVLIPSGRKDEFNKSLAQFDVANYAADVEDRITQLSGDAGYAQMLTDLLLPDVLTFDQASSDGFLNGRRLDDDVIDIELGVLTNGALTTDMVDSNDREFSDSFPYLAPPH